MPWPWKKKRKSVPADGEGTMAAGLARARAWSGPVATIIDVGAAEGKWAALARTIYPAAAILMVEPLAERTAELAERARRDGNMILEACALGESRGEVAFSVSPDLDGSGVYASGPGRQVALETVDHLVARHGLKGPFLLKLDTHGYELPILRGMARTLPETSLVIVEAYNFQVSPTAVRFAALTGELEARGFRCADLVDVMRRPSDRFLWQVDLFFGRAALPNFGDDRYAS